jgi:selenocysteine-specific translation elongation factor
MPNLTVAVLAPNDYAKDLGKKGTVSDITFYNLKKGADTVTFVEPTRYPEKISSLFFTLSLADSVLFVVDQIDARFGECVLEIQSAGLKKGRIILKNYITVEQIAPLIEGTVLQHYAVILEEFISLRDTCLAEAAKKSGKGNVRSGASGGSVPVDHHYNVKGVGIVVLGCVTEGVIRKHDTLKVLPSGSTAQVRSIQKHDDDADSAVAGDRVGLALKNVEAEDIDRGFVLTSDPTVKSAKTITAKASLVKYWPSPIKEGMVICVGHWMQFVTSRVESVVAEHDWRMPTLTITLSRELVYPPGATAVLHYLEGGKLRVIGSMKLP